MSQMEQEEMVDQLIWALRIALKAMVTSGSVCLTVCLAKSRIRISISI